MIIEQGLSCRNSPFKFHSKFLAPNPELRTSDSFFLPVPENCSILALSKISSVKRLYAAMPFRWFMLIVINKKGPHAFLPESRL
jgi:hypothetical protein